MPAVAIKPGIYWIGVNDRTTNIFEGIWPTSQEGVSYNSYLVLGEEKLERIPVDVVAPSHGLIWRKDPRRIISLCERWAECADGKTEPAITLIYGSMYGSTEAAVNAVAQGISRAGIPFEILGVARTHVSYILPSLWMNAGVAVGAPTYEVRLFPPMADVLNMAAHKRIMNRKAVYFGSFGWSGGALKEVKKIVEPLKREFSQTFEFAGQPTKEDPKKGEELGRTFAESILRGT